MDKLKKKGNMWLVGMSTCSVFLLGCLITQNKDQVVLVEPIGENRHLEYVKIKLPHTKSSLLLKDTSNGQILQGEQLSQDYKKDSSMYVFPVSLKAHEKRTFYILDQQPESHRSKHLLKVKGNEMDITIDNGVFVSDFTSTESKLQAGLYPGQLAGINIKKNKTRLKRTRINMHWAPNFQKTGSNDYKTIGHVSLENTKILKNAYYLSMAKTGRVKGYGEIDLQGKYEFYAGLPYFEYSSTMTFNADAHLFLLRNNEMTLDKLFTHLIYPDPHGRLAEIPLYNDTHIDSLAKAPLADDISWLGFINKSMDYGLVGLTLDYDNQNKMGETSPLFEPHLKISKGRQEGRYWNRRLIHDHNVLVPEGSRYYEHNAYLILDNLDDVDGQIDHYIKCLKNPITVEYLTN